MTANDFADVLNAHRTHDEHSRSALTAENRATANSPPSSIAQQSPFKRSFARATPFG